MSTRCQNCGTETDGHVRFCPNCGQPTDNGNVNYATQINDNTDSLQHQTSHTHQPSHKTNRKLIYWVLTLCIIIVVVISIFIVKAALDHKHEKEVREAAIEQAEQKALQEEEASHQAQREAEEAESKRMMLRVDGVEALSEILRTQYFEIYDKSNGYFLFDITGDGLPEMFIEKGTCEADREIVAYDASQGTARRLGAFPTWHSGIFRGKDYLIKYGTHSGAYFMSRVTWNGSKFLEKEIYSDNYYEHIDDPDWEPKEPSEPSMKWYNVDNTNPIRKAFGLQ